MSNVKNVDAFARILGFCTGFGGNYNPGQQNLQVAGLQAMLTNSRNALLQVHLAKTENENAINAREIAYAKIPSLAVRIIAELASSGASPQTIADALTAKRKITGYIRSNGGQRAPIPSGEAGENGKPGRRARGLDFVTIADNFEKLLQTLATEPLYMPTAEELKSEQLQAVLSNLREHNARVIQSLVNWHNARTQRNELFYGNNGSMFNTAKAVKDKVKAIFGFKSEAYQGVLAIRLTKPNP